MSDDCKDGVCKLPFTEIVEEKECECVCDLYPDGCNTLVCPIEWD